MKKEAHKNKMVSRRTKQKMRTAISPGANAQIPNSMNNQYRLYDPITLWIRRPIKEGKYIPSVEDKRHLTNKIS